MAAYVCYECVAVACEKVTATPCRIDISNGEVPCRCVISPDNRCSNWIPISNSETLRPDPPKGLRLNDLIRSGILTDLDFELVHHDDGDAPYATVCGIATDSITPEGKEYWADVLDSQIHSFGNCLGTLMIRILMPDDERSMDRVKDFTMAYAGYCSVENSERWFKI